MAEALSRSADYRILRRLVARPAYVPTPQQDVRIGVLLDTETTGLDHAKDEIIELGMVKFDYAPDGRIVGVRDTFSFADTKSAQLARGCSNHAGREAQIISRYAHGLKENSIQFAK